MKRRPHRVGLNHQGTETQSDPPRISRITRIGRRSSAVGSVFSVASCRMFPASAPSVVASFPPFPRANSISRARSCRLRLGTHPASRPRSCLCLVLLFSLVSCTEDLADVTSFGTPRQFTPVPGTHQPLEHNAYARYASCVAAGAPRTGVAHLYLGYDFPMSTPKLISNIIFSALLLTGCTTIPVHPVASVLVSRNELLAGKQIPRDKFSLGRVFKLSGT